MSLIGGFARRRAQCPPLSANPSYPLAATSSHFCRYAPDAADIGHEDARLAGMLAPMYQELARG